MPKPKTKGQYLGKEPYPVNRQPTRKVTETPKPPVPSDTAVQYCYYDNAAYPLGSKECMENGEGEYTWHVCRSVDGSPAWSDTGNSTGCGGDTDADAEQKR